MTELRAVAHHRYRFACLARRFEVDVADQQLRVRTRRDQYLTERGGHDAAAHPGRPHLGDLVTGIGLADRGDHTCGVDRAGARQQRPLIEFARSGTPRRVRGDQLGAALGQFDV